MTERVEIDVDEGTARWLRGCAQQRGATMAAAAAARLRELALVESAEQHDRFFAEISPTYLEDAHEENQAAFAAAGIG